MKGEGIENPVFTTLNKKSRPWNFICPSEETQAERLSPDQYDPRG